MCEIIMDKSKKAIQKYVDTATELAESVKRNIVHEGIIDDETILKLNKFIIAANEIADMLSELTLDENETDKNLN